ncbi:hypothetical protein CesoFtcFv8_007779 [Champsocephalus esox]|uniref:Uncharacterized protein n=1 Tax=Champsocephalus esox TaxID=159716 RepID=A0AAN8CHI7_9TELE|nr:hypothetical protein CesoFtcFv8_007779 [Champsocephalus esox]
MGPEHVCPSSSSHPAANNVRARERNAQSFQLRRRNLGDATVSDCPFLLHGKGHSHHQYTTHGSHHRRLEVCGEETFRMSL